MAINEIGTIGSLKPTRSLFDTLEKLNSDTSISVPFSDYLKQALNNTNDLLIEADTLADNFAAGKTDNIHQVALAAEKADIALQFTMQIRNKIMDAYSEIMRMQI
ncbi:MAG: flagellar hook-basal body complex protein FliE [Clostridia bacterium]|nr:flagellar hook-basal body complex protein FliE [Clostridia bacterium]